MVDDVLASQPASYIQSEEERKQTERAVVELTSHEEAVVQLRARGLTYEPAALGLPLSTGGVWQALDAAHVQVIEIRDLEAIVKAATGNRTTTDTAMSIAIATTIAASRPSWMSIAQVLGRPTTLFGMIALSVHWELLGFVRLRNVHQVAAESWHGAGDTEQRLPSALDGSAPNEARIGFLPLSTLRDSVLPAMSAIDAEQGGLAKQYLAAVEDLIAWLKAINGLPALAAWFTDYQSDLRVSCGLYQYLHAIPVPVSTGAVHFHVEYWDEQKGLMDNPRRGAIGGYLKTEPEFMPVAVTPLATASALLQFRALDLCHDNWRYRVAQVKVAPLRLQEIQRTYLSERPFILDTAHHPHVLELSKASRVCNVCSTSGGGEWYRCRRCDWDVHPHCVSAVGVQVMDEAKGKKRKREEQVASAGPRGPFHVLRVYYKHGEYTMRQYDTEASLRDTCKQEMHDLRGYGGVGVGEENGTNEATWDEMDVDELVELVLQSTGDSERYNWREVIEGGRTMSKG